MISDPCKMANTGVDVGLSKLKLLLPAPTTLEIIWSALRGVSSIAWNTEDRRAMETMIEKGIIQDQVLQNSRHHSQVSPGGTGSVLTLALFDSLHHNPLWNRYGFDSSDFCKAVGPALANFHDSIFQLQQEETERMRERYTKDSATKKSNEDGGSSSLESSVDEKDLKIDFEKSTWVDEAKANPDSLVASVVRMTTPAFLQHLYESAVTEFLLREKLPAPLLGHSNQSSNNTNDDSNEPIISFASTYVKGSAKVGPVAILRARAMEVEDPNEDYRFEEFKASDPDFGKDKLVAAQIDVLFEISCRFRESLSLRKLADIMLKKTLGGDIWKDEDDQETNSKGGIDKQEELVQYTRLGVAVLEGWLHNSKENNNQLQWKVPMLREPVEFYWNDIDSVVRTVVNEDDDNNNDANSQKDDGSNDKNSKE